MIGPGNQNHTRIRPMELKDVARVREIDVASFTLPWPERSYRFEIQENPASRNFIVEVASDGQNPVVAGMIVMWFIIDEAHIGTIAIDTPYRRLGLGRLLLAESLLDAYRSGIQQSFLEVRRGNQPAITLYEQFGFQVAGIRPRYYKDNGEDALLMTLSPLQPERLEALRRK
ncbi:MAG TPA: ribosomal protein S18-alanine N-acetyltransferase [Bellilinea sp.]|nr:ribosomal protein S18-alanine N-acetyltransferase [Bellilinea sp.]